MNNERLERALRAGPPFAARYVPLPLQLGESRTRRMPTLKTALVAIALLLLALGASVLAAGLLWTKPPITSECTTPVGEADAVDATAPSLAPSERGWDFGPT